MQVKTNNMATVAKTQNKTKKQQTISKENRKQIARAYYQLYRAFLLKNLLSGMTLGMSSHNALQLVRSKIATMDKNNPVTKYLSRINARHSRRIAKRVMTSKYRDALALANPETRVRMNASIPKWTKSALDTLNKMSTQYGAKAIAKSAPVKPVSKPVQATTKPSTVKKPAPAQQLSPALQVKLMQMQLKKQYQYAA